ncbi:MAG: integral rane sensor signal transduction histidine kinase [Acidimicrobiaceae bacterium]|nr:integral rane sensor signal transduction histidine kinase [Acidimicrobiaceae bacterium]
MKLRLSLRARLLFAIGAVSLLVLVIADVSVYTASRSYLYGQVNNSLAASHLPVQRAAVNAGTGRDPAFAPASGRGLTFNSSLFCAIGREGAPGMFIEVRAANGSIVPGEKCVAYEAGRVAYTPKIPSHITGFKPNKTEFHEPTTYFTTASTTASGPQFRVRASRLSDGGVLIVAMPVNGVSTSLARLLALELLVTAVALAAALLLGRWLVRIGLRPLRDVERTADAIAAGDLMRRVPNANTKTEVGHVATAFNVMLERIQAAFHELQLSENRSRRFVADASHELRTPIAAVSSYAQLFQRGAAERPEDLTRVLAGIERESGRMTRLVEDLLLLAHLDEHEHLLVFERVELAGLVAEAIETATTVGPKWPVRLDADEAVEVSGDHVALRQVVDNLLSNVRAHTPEGTYTLVRVISEEREATIEVIDTGPGLSEDQASAVFERFFRADLSRSRTTGGAGLGLAIVAAVVAAHGGRVDATPRPGGGMVFSVHLPLIEEPAGDRHPAPGAVESGLTSASRI